MKTMFIGICLILGCLGANGEEPSTSLHGAAIPRLYVIGDSTAASYPDDRSPLTGWAQVLQDAFDADRLIVENRAKSGRSSKSFFEEGAWQPILEALKPGDFVFIQFGHNDSNKDDPNRFTEPDTTYKAFLTTYVENTRSKGATPILLTPINRNRWNADGVFEDSMGEYPRAVRELAKALDVPVIDMHRLTETRFSHLGPDGTRQLFLYLKKGESPNYPDGKEDGTHLCLNGAREICSLAVDEIRNSRLPLAAYLK
ncbi:MAG: hypothetical protein AMXMBFR84_32230 [Candidatus Hydrogenedentota bacterium]